MIPYIKRYVELGFIIHPCCPPDHKCQSPGKIPFDPIAGKHMSGWQEHGQFGLDEWQDWLDYESSINLGFLCGSPSGLVCIDIDDMKAKEILNDDGIRGWDTTWQYQTGRGLRSLFRSVHRSFSGVVTRGDTHYEILGDGRQSVLPPSLHPNGNRYTWDPECSPSNCECHQAGDWAIGGVGGGAAGGITSDREDWRAIVLNGAQSGNRNTNLTRIAGHLMNPCPMTAEEAYVWLSMYNGQYCKPPLPDRELRSIVSSIRKLEAVQQRERDEEIRSLMSKYALNYSEAEQMWRGM